MADHQGTRVAWEKERIELQPCEYAAKDGAMWGCTPNGVLVNVYKIDAQGWEVTENADGTVSVMPSIKISTRRPDGVDEELWHGHLLGGIWRGAAPW